MSRLDSKPVDELQLKRIQVNFDDDCEFQRPILEAIKQERDARK